MIHIVTDSTADIPAHCLAELNIQVVPCFVTFGRESFLDGINLSRDQFYTRLARDAQLPSTAAPSVGRFAQVYQSLARPGDDVISIHAPDRLSSICNAARLGGQADSRLHVVDSGSMSMGLGWQVIAAARAAREGRSVSDILAMLDRLRPHVYVFAALDTVDFLRRSGRVNWAAAFLGQVLNVKPIIRLYGGVVDLTERVRTSARAMVRLVELVTRLGRLEQLAVMHTQAPAKAELLVQRVSGLLPPGTSIPIVEVTPTIGVHVGPGGTGLAVVLAHDDIS
jgi:DegV family protein with EDD domain